MLFPLIWCKESHFPGQSSNMVSTDSQHLKFWYDPFQILPWSSIFHLLLFVLLTLSLWGLRLPRVYPCVALWAFKPSPDILVTSSYRVKFCQSLSDNHSDRLSQSHNLHFHYNTKDCWWMKPLENFQCGAFSTSHFHYQLYRTGQPQVWVFKTPKSSEWSWCLLFAKCQQ
jgi:hypothetical protein